MIGYFNGNNQTLWVMVQGLVQTLLVRLPFAYIMSIQPNASLTKIGLAAPVSTTVGIILNVLFYLHLNRKKKKHRLKIQKHQKYAKDVYEQLIEERKVQNNGGF